MTTPYLVRGRTANSQRRFSLTAPETLRSRITDITRARQPRGFAARHNPVWLSDTSVPTASRA